MSFKSYHTGLMAELSQAFAGGFDLQNRKTRFAIKAALATVIATFVALYLHLDAPYWAGISAFLVSAEHIENSFQKTLLRMGCTWMGVLLGILSVHFFANQALETVLVTFIVLTYAIFRGFRDNQFYLWVFSAITFFMVMAEFMATGSRLETLDIALYRGWEITIGSGVSFLVGLFVFPQRAPKSLGNSQHLSSSLRLFKPKIEPWLKSLKRDGFYWLLGIKVALTMVSIPLLWTAFGLPGGTQLGVSMAAVLNLDLEASKKKGLMRLYGCLLGALIALGLLMFARVESLGILLGLVFVGAFCFARIHNTQGATAYIGTQALVAFLMGFVTDFSPALTLDPAVERLIGILFGVLVLFLVLDWLWPFSTAYRIKGFQAQINGALARMEIIVKKAQLENSNLNFNFERSMAYQQEIYQRHKSQYEAYPLPQTQDQEARTLFLKNADQAFLLSPPAL